jgi:phytanoyl-CoA hydroxylase
MDPREQKDFFATNGYLIIPQLLDDAELEKSRSEIHRLHHCAANLEKAGKLSRSDFQLEPYAPDQRANGLPVLRKIENTRRHSDWFGKLAAHPKLVRVVQQLIGGDLLLFRSTLMLKPAQHGSAHALHQASAYWPMDPPTLITVSIALDDATPANGCIKVIAKSHEWDLQEWGHIAQAQETPLTTRDDIDLSTQIEVPLKAGSALLFHSKLVHGSGPNKTDRSRHTALYAYFSPAVRYMPGPDAPRSRSFPVISGLDGATDHTLIAD